MLRNPQVRHLLEGNDVTRDELDKLIMSAAFFKQIVRRRGGIDVLRHRILGLCFFEPSTRTSCSFAAAMVRLGGSVIELDHQNSSQKKGESVDDTVQSLSCFVNAICCRHSENGTASRLATLSGVPIINAGDGTCEHPTQALLDIFTMSLELGSIEGKRICMVGDLKNSRTVHSLVGMLCMFEGVTIDFIAPDELQIPDHIIGARAHSKGQDIDITSCDVLYVTRIQEERFECHDDFLSYKGSYVVNARLLEQAKEKMIVMHPLPRVDEISTDVDCDPRAAYFRQCQNGMFMRMAILHWLIEGTFLMGLS